MKRTLLSLALAISLIGLAGGARAQTMVTGANPETIRALFATWGHQPGAMETPEDQPMFTAQIDGGPNIILLAGCTAGHNCTQIIFVCIYSDIRNPPYEWLNRQNIAHDMVTSLRRDDGLLVLHMGVTLGTEGIPASVLQAAFEEWRVVNGEIARSAVAAGLQNPAGSR